MAGKDLINLINDARAFAYCKGKWAYVDLLDTLPEEKYDEVFEFCSKIRDIFECIDVYYTENPVKSFRVEDCIYVYDSEHDVYFRDNGEFGWFEYVPAYAEDIKA